MNHETFSKWIQTPSAGDWTKVVAAILKGTLVLSFRVNLWFLIRDIRPSFDCIRPNLKPKKSHLTQNLS